MNYNYDIAIIDNEKMVSTIIVDALLQQNIRAIAIEDRKNAPIFLSNNPTRFIIVDGTLYDNNEDLVLKLYDNCRKSKIIYAMEDNLPEIEQAKIRKFPINMVIRKPYSINDVVSILNQGGLLTMSNFDGKQNPMQNPYGQPMNNPYGQPQNDMGGAPNPFGQPQMGGMNQPPMNNPYGQPMDMGGGAPNPYGQPMDMGGAPNPFGQPQMGGINQPPMNNPYGQPIDMGGGAPNPYGQPMDMGGASNPYGQPQNDMGGAPNPFGQPQMGGMNQPPMNNPYGQPMDMGGGAPNPYGQPMDMGGGAPNPYGQPMDMGGAPNPYGQPMDMGGAPNPYGQPQNDMSGAPNPFGQPQMGGMNQPPMNNPYGQPMDMGGGAPNPYGQPMDMGGAPNPYGQPTDLGPIQAPYNPAGAANVNPSTNAFKQMVIAVNCPKGGVGKTTISKELAIAYATTRVNGKPLKVCLVDGNIGFGDVTTMLKVPSRPNIKTWTTNIQDKLQNNPDVMPRYSQQTIENEYLIKHPTGLYILAAPANHADSLDIDADQMGAVIENLKNCDFDIIIIDTANNTQDYTLIALEKAEVILMVTTMEITSISDTRALLATLREIQFPVEKIKLVINKMPQKQDKDIDTQEIAMVLQTQIIGAIPDYPSIRKINNGGEPAMLGKDNELTIAIKDLANKVVPVFGTSVNGKGQPSGEKKSLFGGLFKKK